MTSRSSSPRPLIAAEEPGLLLAVEDRRLGRWGRISGSAILGGPDGEDRPPSGRTAPVPGLVRDDPQEPRPERGAVPEPAQRGVGLDEGLLDGVLRVAVGREQMRRPDGHVLLRAGPASRTPCRRLSARVRSARRRCAVRLPVDGPPRSTVPSTPRRSVGFRAGHLEAAPKHRIGSTLLPLETATLYGRGTSGARVGSPRPR